MALLAAPLALAQLPTVTLPTTPTVPSISPSSTPPPPIPSSSPVIDPELPPLSSSSPTPTSTENGSSSSATSGSSGSTTAAKPLVTTPTLKLSSAQPRVTLPRSIDSLPVEAEEGQALEAGPAAAPADVEEADETPSAPRWSIPGFGLGVFVGALGALLAFLRRR